MESSMSGRSALVLACALMSTARADTIDATVTTLLAGHQDPRDGKIYTVVPAYESVSLVADLRVPHLDGLRVVLSGWGMVAFGDPRDRAASGDFDAGFVEARAFGRVGVRLGRQLIVGGAARVTPLDGASVDWRIWRRLGLTVYGGAPVAPRFGISRGDAAGGGRLFWRHSADTEVGFSFIQVNGQGRTARQDLALDGRWGIVPSLALTGYADLSARAQRLAEATLAVSWQPIGRVQLAAEYRRSAPELFLPLNSIFSVFAQTTRDEVGATAFAQAGARIRVYGDYHLISDDSGIGHRGGAKGAVTLGPATVGSEVRVLALPNDGYLEARLFGVARLSPALTLTLDGDAFRLERPINGESFSFTAAATLGWDFARGWRTVVTGIADVTPFVEHRFELVAKLVYNFTLRFHEVRP
jgi:hypothetical protein